MPRMTAFLWIIEPLGHSPNGQPANAASASSVLWRTHRAHATTTQRSTLAEKWPRCVRTRAGDAPEQQLRAVTGRQGLLRFWDCCGAEEEAAPGCEASFHITWDEKLNEAHGWE
jgi:hypothetical protein